MSKILNELVNNQIMPSCIYKAKIKKFFPQKMYLINMPHLQTSKHRFRTYPKPISKIVSL